MLSLEEVRNLTPSDVTPDITYANCKRGVSPDEVRRLIAESRARTFGLNGLVQMRSAYRELQPGGNTNVVVQQAPAATESLESISLF